MKLRAKDLILKYISGGDHPLQDTVGLSIVGYKQHIQSNTACFGTLEFQADILYGGVGINETIMSVGFVNQSNEIHYILECQ